MPIRIIHVTQTIYFAEELKNQKSIHRYLVGNGTAHVPIDRYIVVLQQKTMVLILVFA